MANKSSSTVKEKSPRITKEQLKEIVEFYKACKDYDLTARTFEDKWKKEYNWHMEDTAQQGGNESQQLFHGFLLKKKS